MSRDKQIEEMAKSVCHLDRTCNQCMTSFECKAMTYAKRFHNAGYRKASEVAREIFAEIENFMNEVYSSVQYGCYSYGMTKQADSPSAQRQCGKLEAVKYIGDWIAELKKKYAEASE